MNDIKEKYQELTNEFHNGETLFLMGLTLYLWRAVWVTTMFPLSGVMTIVCIPLAALLIAVKVILYDHYSRKSFLLLAGSVICILLVVICSRSVNPLLWFLLVVGSRNVSFEKILKVYLAVNLTIVGLAFCSSLLGVIENLQYTTEARGIRNSFGIIYPTDFAAHVFFMNLVFFYLKGETLKWYHYLCTVIIAGLVYYFCNARLDSLMYPYDGWFVWAWELYGIFEKSEDENTDCLGWTWEKAGMFVMPALAVFSIVMTILYQPNNLLWLRCDKIVNGRLNFGHRGIEEYGIKLFGQAIEMIGFGGSTAEQLEYNFVDCSYVHVLLRYGIMITIVLFVMYLYCCYRNKHDLYFLYAVALVAVNCVIAHHIMQTEYNPFALALMAKGMRIPGKWNSIKYI